MTVEELRGLIAGKKIKNMILDTDTYNEVDDQFALAYAMLSPESVRLLSVNAAPFLNNRSSSPEDGMEKSYAEILKIMKLVSPSADIPVYRGSKFFMTSKDIPVESEACDNIVNTVMNSDEPVFIVAIGAITNVASAIVKCPEITKRAAVVWLGGNAIHAPHTREFNMYQDVFASQIVLDSGIPLVQIPCEGVCTEFATTVPELEYYLRGKNSLCDYLVDIVSEYSSESFAWSKIIWDVTAVGTLTVPGAFSFTAIPTPILTREGLYAFDSARHPYVYVRKLYRDPLFADLFKKLSSL